MNPLPLFWDLFETNRFTLVLVLVFGACALFRFFPARPAGAAPGRRWLIAALALGLVLRAGWIAFSAYEPKTAWQTDLLESDATNIHALEFSRGIWFHDAEGRPTARRPIGYPVALGLCYRLFGPHALVPWILNLSLFALSLIFLYRLARVLLGEAPALWTAFLYAVYPVSVYSIKLVTDEHLFLALWYGGLALLTAEIRGRKIPFAVAWYGLIFGIAAMTRTHAIFMPAVVAFVYWRMGRGVKRAAGALVGILFLMQLVNVPWVLRNQKVFGTPVLYTATNQFVYPQFNSTATFEGNGRFPRPGEEGFSEELEAARLGGVNEGRYHQLAGKAMAQWAKAHPLRVLQLGAGRLIIFMGWDRRGVWPIWFQYMAGEFDPARPLSQSARDALEWAADAFYYVLFFGTIAGAVLLVLARKRLDASSRTGLAAVGLCFLLWMTLQMVIYPDRKYRFPLEPLMLGVTAYALCRTAGLMWSVRRSSAKEARVAQPV